MGHKPECSTPKRRKCKECGIMTPWKDLYCPFCAYSCPECTCGENDRNKPLCEVCMFT